MPIDYALYPPDWKEISKRIREREEQKCKWCGAANGQWIQRLRSNPFEWMPAAESRLSDWCEPIKVVLTVAHLNHTPMDCRDDNLAALCQRCHLRYDHEHHMKNGAATRARKKGLQNLFEPTQPMETTMDDVTAATDETETVESVESESQASDLPPDVEPIEDGDEPDDDLTAPRELEEKGSEMQTLKMPVTEERYRALSEQLVAEQRELDAVRAEKKEIDGRLGRQIKNHETVISKIAKTLDEGEEETAVRCVWTVDYTNNVKELRREDTGAVVQSVPLTADEKQLKIEEFNGAAVEVSEERSGPARLKCNVCGWEWETLEEGAETKPCPNCQSTAVSFRERREGEEVPDENIEVSVSADQVAEFGADGEEAASLPTEALGSPEEDPEVDPEENPVPTAGARHRGRPRCIKQEKIAEAFPEIDASGADA